MQQSQSTDCIRIAPLFPCFSFTFPPLTRRHRPHPVPFLPLLHLFTLLSYHCRTAVFHHYIFLSPCSFLYTGHPVCLPKRCLMQVNDHHTHTPTHTHCRHLPPVTESSSRVLLNPQWMKEEPASLQASGGRREVEDRKRQKEGERQIKDKSERYKERERKWTRAGRLREEEEGAPAGWRWDEGEKERGRER